MSKRGTAPCGHPGEYIVGTYVRCLQGCEDIGTSGAQIGARSVHRGEPGHVHMCACKPCQVRRRAAAVILRTDKGHDYARILWDGVGNSITFPCAATAKIRGYRLMDGDGVCIAEGPLDLIVLDGYTITIDITLFTDKVPKLQVHPEMTKSLGDLNIDPDGNLKCVAMTRDEIMWDVLAADARRVGDLVHKWFQKWVDKHLTEYERLEWVDKHLTEFERLEAQPGPTIIKFPYGVANLKGV